MWVFNCFKQFKLSSGADNKLQYNKIWHFKTCDPNFRLFQGIDGIRLEVIESNSTQ